MISTFLVGNTTYEYQNASGVLTASGLIFTGSCILVGLIVSSDGTNDLSLVVYDNTAGSGTKLIPTIRLLGVDKQYIVGFNPAVKATNGIYVSVTCTGTYEYKVLYN